MANTFYSRLRALVNKWTTPPSPAGLNEIRYWQDRLLFTLLLVGFVFGFPVYIPSVALCIKEQLWTVAVVDTVIYGWVVVLFFRRSLPFVVRASSVVYIGYALGMVLLLTVGPFGAGPVWLFAFPVLAAVFLGIRTAIMALAINSVSVTAMGLLIAFGVLQWQDSVVNAAYKWVVIGLNFTLLNAIVAISVAYITRGLMISLKQEKGMRGSLEQKHGVLMNFTRQLEAEMVERVKAEKALKESEERYRALFDRSLELVYLYDFEGNFLDANDAVLQLMEYSREDIRSLNFNSLLSYGRK